MTDLISWPFRLTPDGDVVVGDDTTPDYMAGELAQVIQTIPGERELVPDYGLEDTAFDHFDTGALVTLVEIFGPPVIIESVTVKKVGEARQDVVISFEVDDTADEYDPVGTELDADDDSEETYDADS